MTKEKIIDCITKNKSCSYVAVGEDLKSIESTRLYQFSVVEIEKTAVELLTLMKQEKKEDEEQLLLEFYNFVLCKRFNKCHSVMSDYPYPIIRRATLFETDLKNDIEEFLQGERR